MLRHHAPRHAPRQVPPPTAATLAIAALLHALAPSLARAQSADTTRLRPMVVTATLVPVRSDAAPGAVTVIDGKTLRTAGISSVADALRRVGGASVVQNGSFGATTSLFVRGGNSNYVKVLVDGVPLNAPGGAIDLAHLTTDDVDRIEVARGPSSVLYGSDAVTGVVQIFTRTGAARTSGSLSARGGSFGTREGSADLAGGGARAGWSLAAASRRTDGILAFNNDYANDAGAGSARATFAGTDLQLATRVNDATFHYPTNGSGVAVDSNARREERRWVLAAEATRAFGARVRSRLALTANDLDAHNDNAPDGPADTAGFYSSDRARSYRRGGDLRVDVRLPGAATLTAGGAVERQQIRSSGTSRFMRFDPTTTAFAAHRTNRAAFAQLLGAGESRLSYSLGARVDDNSAFGTFTTGRGSVAFRVAPGTRLRAAAGTAFKEPAFDETFSSTYTIGNPDLRPERARSWEAGVEHAALDDRLRVSATWFDQRFRNLIQYVSGGAETEFRGTNANLAAATARGLELAARALPIRWLDVGASFTRLRTDVVDAGTGAFGAFEAGEQLIRRPGSQGTVDVGVRAARGLDLRALIQMVGPRDDRDFDAGARVVLPGYARLDVGGEYRVPGARGAAITVRVDNLLDRRYEPVLHFAAPGRTVLVGARVAR